MRLKESQCASGIKEFLRYLDPISLKNLATNASNNRITTASTKEVVEIILQIHRETGEVLLLSAHKSTSIICTRRCRFMGEIESLR